MKDQSVKAVNTVPCENGYLISVIKPEGQENFVAKTTDEAVEIYKTALLQNLGNTLKVK